MHDARVRRRESELEGDQKRPNIGKSSTQPPVRHQPAVTVDETVVPVNTSVALLLLHLFKLDLCQHLVNLLGLCCRKAPSGINH